VKTNSTAIGLQVSEIEFLGVLSGPPVVVAPYTLPATQVALVGSTATLPVEVGGSTPFTFQWTFNGGNLSNGGRISGAQSNLLTLTNVQYSDAGAYELNITNAQGFYDVYPDGGADQNLLVIAVPTLLTNGLGWSTSANPAAASPLIDNNILMLTDSTGSSARAAFFGSPVYIGAFRASFTYRDQSGPGAADGFTFCLQNDPRGPAALGGPGGALGVSGITPSAELTFNIYAGSPGGVGMAFGTNGNNGNPYASTAPVDISSSDFIDVVVLYRNGVAQVSLTDEQTSAQFSTNLAVGDLSTRLGASTAYVGFTGADGGSPSTQTITAFEFIPLTTLAAQVSGSNLLLTWPLQPAGYILQSTSSLSAPNWQNVTSPVTTVGAQNQVSLPLGPGSDFFRLVVPLPQ
jgi:hypothetical protein